MNSARGARQPSVGLGCALGANDQLGKLSRNGGAAKNNPSEYHQLRGGIREIKIRNYSARSNRK
jgi:hypothetical protein